MPHQSDDDLTIAPGSESTREVTPPVPRTPGGVPAGTGRFAPGVIVAGRYRLVALLGRGGMGEVYRADDLTLDQPVALKFLPEGMADDAARLTQFHNELRVARQVSHKNVCRLYDLGDADGRRFLTMEYVDGEDLASLLRRIGRFPEDRAIAIARQLCAGVAAAHERGVIHRDLKPANVMIDGEGDVRITDFGIATAAADVGAPLAGTPQYMAPEQLTGTAASAKTDIYALGLILFEIFTGRRAYEAKTINDLKALHDTGSVTTPTSIVKDLDPAIERLILRCLDRSPERRPGSALAVAAGLPGGDPLAEALAAGETPSPEMLVAAGETGTMPIRQAIGLIAILGVALGVYSLASPAATIAAMIGLDKPPAVLADRAQQIATSLGYNDQPADEMYGFVLPVDYPRWLATTRTDADRWRALAAGPAMLLWHRTSPRPLVPIRYSTDVTLVGPNDPPFNDSFMRLSLLDMRGRLVEFHAVPPQYDSDKGVSPAVRWEPLFDAAGLAFNAFSSVDPEWTPRDYADTRAAWTGPFPDQTGMTIRVEAAAYRGRPISFTIVGPWARPGRMQPLPQSALRVTLGSFALLLWMSALIGAIFVARYHLRTNRADRKSAARLAVSFILLQLVGWLFGSHHVPDLNDELISLFKALGAASFAGGFLWVLYLAIEPYGRRFWPDGLLGWSRLLSGRFRDPRVGRDVLVGCGLGSIVMLLDLARQIAPTLIGAPPAVPALGRNVRSLVGPGWLVLDWSQQLYSTVQSALFITLVFVAIRLVVKRTWIAVPLGIAIVVAASSDTLSTGGVVWIDLAFATATMGIITWGIFRYGLLTAVTLMFVDNLPTSIPFTGRLFHWSATPAIATVLLILALGAFAFHAARAAAPSSGRADLMRAGSV